MVRESMSVFAIKENELADGEKKPLLIDGRKVLMIRQEGDFFALSNLCPHMECPLSKGTLEKHMIICPCHDWRFDIRTGEFLDAKEIKAHVYETKLVDGSVYISMENLEGSEK